MKEEDHLSVCPGPELTTDCSADLCRPDTHNIFLDNMGNFRKPVETVFHCNSHERLCSEHVKSEDIQTWNANGKEVSCKKNTFENFDSVESLRCQWSSESVEQVECMERMHGGHTGAGHILCCTPAPRLSTVFLLASASASACTETELLSCGSHWSSWSGWQVSKGRVKKNSFFSPCFRRRGYFHSENHKEQISVYQYIKLAYYEY